MRIFHELVVDDFIADTFSHQIKSVSWEAVMGNFETLRFFVVANSVSGTSPTLTLQFFEEPDLTYIRNWSATPINGVALTAGQENLLTASISASDAAMPASYGYRLDYNLGGTSPTARVRIWVTGRGKA